MAIALDGSTPAIDQGHPGSLTYTTIAGNAFTPPSGSLVVVMVSWGFGSGTATALSVQDNQSSPVTYSATGTTFQSGPGATATCVGFHYYATSPGSIRITVTATVGTGAAPYGIQVVPYVLTGCASSQSGAAATHASSGTVSVSTTQTGSWVLLAGASGLTGTVTPNGSTSTISNFQDGTSGDGLVAGKQTNPTGTPGPTTLGWTAGAEEISALEILPSTGPSSIAVTGVPAAIRATAAAGLVPLVAATLTKGEQAAPAASWATASVSPAGYALLIAWVNNVSGASTSGVSGLGLTWARVPALPGSQAVGSQTFDGWWAVTGASPASGAITVTPSASSSGFWVVDQVTGPFDTGNPFVVSNNRLVTGTAAAYSWGFEDGTVQGWSGTGGSGGNATVANSTGWAYEGTHSLVITATGGGAWWAGSPAEAVTPGMVVTATAYVYAPQALAAVQVNLAWNAGGTYLSSTYGSTKAVGAGQYVVLSVTGAVPPGANLVTVSIVDNETPTVGWLMYADAITLTALPAAAVTLGSYAVTVAGDSPAAWWKLADAAASPTAADSSGNGHTGTPTNVTFGVAGAVAGATAASFNGTSSRIDTAYNPALSAVTVEAWVNLDGNAVSGNPRIIADSHTDVDNNGFQLYVNTSFGATNVTFSVGNGSFQGGANTADAGMFLPASGWTHLAGTYAGSVVRIYFNGQQAGTYAMTGTVTAGAANTGIGYNPAYSGDWWHGSIAQAAVYPVALTAAQIAAHYVSGPLAGFSAPSVAGNLLYAGASDASPGGLETFTGTASKVSSVGYP